MISVSDGRSAIIGNQPASWPVCAAREPGGRRDRRDVRRVGIPDGCCSPRWRCVNGSFARSVHSTRTVLTHRPTITILTIGRGQVVQDASYMSRCRCRPGCPALSKIPCRLHARFCSLAVSFVPDVAIDIAAHMDTVVDMLACHQSQVFEFLPFNLRVADQVPQDETDRDGGCARGTATSFGPRRPVSRRLGSAVRRAAWSAGRVGRGVRDQRVCTPLDAAMRRRLFWFL